MLTRPVNVRGFRSDSVVVDSAPRSIQPWQERFRDPALTVLLILELCTIFLAVPLAGGTRCHGKGKFSDIRLVGDAVKGGGTVIALVIRRHGCEPRHSL